MISMRLDARPVTRLLDDVAKRQVPFASAMALTDVAYAAQVGVKRKLPSIFDRPNPFTMNAIGVKPARKTSLEAVVFVRPAQAGYLQLQETGGTRVPKAKALVIPRAAPRNQYGNLARNALRNLQRRKDVFVGKPEGSQHGGFFRKLPDGGLQPLILFVSQAKYRPRFGFQARAAEIVRRTWPAASRQALARALATARG